MRLTFLAPLRIRKQIQTLSKRPIRPLIFRERHPDLRQPQARANVLQWRSFSEV